MDVENHLHTVAEIDSYPAEVETGNSYKNRIDYYESRDYTYAPIPTEMSYYNTKQGWLKDISSNQILSEDTHLMEVLRKMQDYPFLLVDYLNSGPMYVFEDEDGKNILPENIIDSFVGEYSIGMTIDGEELTDEELQDYFSDKEAFEIHEIRKQYPNVAEEHLNKDLGEQYGIVTLVDLNKRGMKQMLYKIISELSATLAREIESEYPDSNDVLKHLRPVTIGRWKKDRINGLNMHISEHMNLIEMMQVIQSSDIQFVERCGFESKKDVQTLNKINDIRNRVMHANRSLIYDRKEISEILDVIQNAQRITSNHS